MSEDTTPDDQERLEKLALALLLHPGDPRAREPRLYLGEIPENLPLEIPSPPQTRVLGTLARSETSIEMVLESDGLTPDEVLSFYRSNLTASGWQALEDRGPFARGGFVQGSSDRYRLVTFCHAESGAGLSLTLAHVDNNSTRVRLDLNLDREMNPCAQPAGRRDPMGMHMQKARQMIPALFSPVDARQSGGGGGGGSNDYHTTALLQTTLELEPLGKHYADQLSQAGWTQTGGDSGGPLSWHTWRFTDEEQAPWTGLLFALAIPAKSGEYFLYIRVASDTATNNTATTGWTTYGGFSHR